MAPIMGDPVEELEELGWRPPAKKKAILKYAKENLVYILKRELQIPGAFVQSEIVAVSTNKEMIFSMGKALARLGKWDYFVLIHDNRSGKFLDKADIPRYKE